MSAALSLARLGVAGGFAANAANGVPDVGSPDGTPSGRPNVATRLGTWDPSNGAQQADDASPKTPLEELFATADLWFTQPPPAKLAGAGVRTETVVPPWRDRQALEVNGRGGLHDYSRRRATVAGKHYTSHVKGDRDTYVRGDYVLEVGGNSAVRTGYVPTPAETGAGAQAQPARLPSASFGRDTLTVDGNVTESSEDHSVNMGGTYLRTWGGGVIRMVGMEGVICGGAFTRMIAGPSLHIGMLTTGDVYGGGLHVAGMRMILSGFGYRSVELSAWAMGLYVRATGFTIVPVVGSPSRTFTKRSIASKMARLTMAVCPPLDILVGAINFLVVMPITLIMAGIRKARGIKSPPAKTLPRSLTRQIGFRNETTGSHVNT